MTTNLRTRLSPYYLASDPGRRFCLLHEPATGVACTRSVVFAHPFGEEMNKSRRMAALQSRRLAAAGCAVLQIDLHGCGDSDGEFADASWECWMRDIEAACDWLAANVGGPIALWGLRLGASLAAAVAMNRSVDVDRLVLWQPVVQGEVFVNQFLRQRLASELIGGGGERNGTKALREQLAADIAVEVSGYRMSALLARSIDGIKLAQCTRAGLRVDWFEVIAEAAQGPSLVSRRASEELRSSGMDVRLEAVRGEPFWATAEIAECPALLDLTTAAISTC